MNKRIKVLKLKDIDYYIKHLEIANTMLPVKLTPKEIEVLGHFLSLQGDIADDRFGTSGRRIVKDRMGLVDGGLGNYLKALKIKGFISEVDGKLDILPFLKIDGDSEMYIFKLQKI